MDHTEFLTKVRQLLKPDEFIFGGAVRDHLTNQPYDDLDIFVDRNNVLDFISRLTSSLDSAGTKGSVAEHDSSISRINHTTTKRRFSFTFSDGQKFNLDLVSDMYDDGETPFKDTLLDADINGLMLHADGSVTAAPGISLKETLDNLSKKQFRTINKSKATRLSKLLEKGYKEVKYKIGDKVMVYYDKRSKVYVDFSSADKQNKNFELREATIVACYRADAGYDYVVAEDPNSQGWEFKSSLPLYADYDKSYSGKAWGIPSASIAGLASSFQTQFDKYIIPKNKKVSASNMNKPENAFETFKSDAHDAGYRVAAKQISKGARAALVQLLKSNGAKRSQIRAVQELLETEGGLAAISMGLGWALKYMPGIKDDPRAQFLAKEFRVDAMSAAGNLALDSVIGNFLPVLMTQLQSLPEPPKVRVSSPPKTISSEGASEEEAETEAKAEMEQMISVPPKVATL